MIYALNMADGSVAIMQTVGDATPEDCLAKWHPDEQAKVVSNVEIKLSDIPADRTFRNAWSHDGKQFSVDMVKAVEIHKNKLRVLRAPLMAALDTQFMRALESGDIKAQQDIAVKKQALRDVTAYPAIALAETPEQLKAAIPPVLLESNILVS